MTAPGGERAPSGMSPWALPDSGSPRSAPASPTGGSDWRPPQVPPGGWPPSTLARPRPGGPDRGLSGLFPSGPPRPTYREPVPIRFGMLVAGILAATLWMVLFGLIATSARAYAWASIVAALLAWASALLLARAGDRGAAVGVAIATGVGLSVAAVVVIVRWAAGDWLLW
jgi:hypothetical protein